MKLVACSFDNTPPMGDGAFIAVHVNLRIVTNVAALDEFVSNPCVVLAKGLVGASDRIKAHRLPRINKAFVFQRFPLGMMGAGRGSPGLPDTFNPVLGCRIAVLFAGIQSRKQIFSYTHSP
jgi:hypothetical protein